MENRSRIIVVKTSIGVLIVCLAIYFICMDSIFRTHGPSAEVLGFKIRLDELRHESFKGKGIRVIKTVEKTKYYTRHLIEYDSKGMNISGMMNIPNGKGPFPVVILNHGHYGDRPFKIGLGFKEAADIFSNNGYVAIGSDLRNSGYSDKDNSDLFALGYIYDVMYLVEAAKELPCVDNNRIGMWGYSSGSLLAMKACIIDNSIRVLALFGPMSADEADNFHFLEKMHSKALKHIINYMGYPDKNPGIYKSMSPISMIGSFPKHIIMHHGEIDERIPVEWTNKLYDSLLKEGKNVEYYVYPGQKHVLLGKSWDVAMDRTIKFFDKHLKKAE